MLHSSSISYVAIDRLATNATTQARAVMSTSGALAIPAQFVPLAATTQVTTRDPVAAAIGTKSSTTTISIGAD